MQMDWGDDEDEVKEERESPNIFESDTSVRREKSDKDEKPSIPNKFADIMARAPTPKVLL